MQHNSYVCTHYIYMTIDIYIYTHICTMYVYVCVCIVMYGCLPASFQPPSSILTASISFQPPSSPLPASLQPPPSLLPAYIINLFLMHRCIDHQFVLVHMCIDNQSCLIYIYVHSPFIFFDNIYALVINLYGRFVTHMYSVFFVVVLVQDSCWCTHQGCLPTVQCTRHAHYAI